MKYKTKLKKCYTKPQNDLLEGMNVSGYIFEYLIRVLMTENTDLNSSDQRLFKDKFNQDLLELDGIYFLKNTKNLSLLQIHQSICHQPISFVDGIGDIIFGPNDCLIIETKFSITIKKVLKKLHHITNIAQRYDIGSITIENCHVLFVYSQINYFKLNEKKKDQLGEYKKIFKSVSLLFIDFEKALAEYLPFDDHPNFKGKKSHLLEYIREKTLKLKERIEFLEDNNLNLKKKLSENLIHLKSLQYEKEETSKIKDENMRLKNDLKCMSQNLNDIQKFVPPFFKELENQKTFMIDRFNMNFITTLESININNKVEKNALNDDKNLIISKKYRFSI